MHHQYKVSIHQRDYSSWEYIPIDSELSNSSISIPFTPFSSKLFHGDIIQLELCKPSSVSIITSIIRTSKYIAGVLILEKNRTYGRTENKKRLLYSCIPFQKELPVFLLPFNISLGFQKALVNKYVVFRFDSWNEKHPRGIITETIGDVTNLHAYYEYQLYCKHLHYSKYILQKKISSFLIQKNIEDWTSDILSNSFKYGNIIDLRKEKETKPIFSIDPEGCTDRDDALSISKSDDSSLVYVSIYIANIWVWLELFDLWKDVHETTVSTIYLPDKKRSMLPEILSEKIASLDIGKSCFTFTMDFSVNVNTKEIKFERFYPSCIHISHNYDYESKSLLKNRNYSYLFQITQQIDTGIQNSHDVVSFWMMQFNQYLAQKMQENKIGIFRITQRGPSTTTSSLSSPSILELSSEMQSFLRIWEESISGSYILYSSDSNNYTHEIMNISAYIHFTSPIRRMVDLLNQLSWIINVVSPEMISDSARTFLHISLQKIDKINQESKDIKKIQIHSQMLDTFTHQSSSQLYQGIIIDYVLNKNGWKYSIYVTDKKCIFTFSSEKKWNLYTTVSFHLIPFEKEHSIQKKIRVCLCEKNI
jgi:exoribonuclease R